MPVPTPRGPRAAGGAKQGEGHHCCHKAEVTDTSLLSGSELPGLIASPGAPERLRPGSPCGVLDAFKVEMGMVMGQMSPPCPIRTSEHDLICRWSQKSELEALGE